jgi:porphobilinogen synthase
MSINLRKDNLVYPYFVTYGSGKKEEISSFPGQYRFSIDTLKDDISELQENGLNKILLFGIPDSKDAVGSAAYKKDNIVSEAIRSIKKKFLRLTIFTDICLCAYADHGHCGILKRHKTQETRHKCDIDNKATLAVLSKIAVAHAEAGADWVAPSAMAKKQVSAIRKALNKNGYKKTKILGYSAKFASGFYGPFRNAADSSPKFEDRSAYQLSYNNIKKALDGIKADIDEGADMVMVKPALAYLDIIREAKNKFKKPLAAYNVSGEYAFVKYGATAGLWKEEDIVKEIIVSIKRAGADYIITYHAKEIAKWLI